MEIILAIVVATAVIFFGALISVGNERQRRAIDSLHKAYKQWALQDLQIKRERLSREIKIDNPQNWLNTVVSKVYGYDLKLQIVEWLEEPQSLLCESADNQRKVVFTTISPSGIRNINKNRRNRLGRFTGDNPLISLPKNVASHELSMLNSGVLFDLELEMVWKQLTGKKLEVTDCLWMYEY